MIWEYRIEILLVIILSKSQRRKVMMITLIQLIYTELVVLMKIE